MLSHDSVFYRLPASLEPIQLVLLDGIRHSAEIAWQSFERLENTLTEIADFATLGRGYDRGLKLAAYMDAWTLVDAVDRFRGLWVMLPRQLGMPEDPPFKTLVKPIRDIRNVADHLATRLEYVAAKGSPVLGLLTWVTYKEGSDIECQSCAIAAGTHTSAEWPLENPMGDRLFGLNRRTGMISLAAGEYRASLSGIVPEVTSRIQHLERLLEKQLRTQGIDGPSAASDTYVSLQMHVPR